MPNILISTCRMIHDAKRVSLVQEIVSRSACVKRAARN